MIIIILKIFITWLLLGILWMAADKDMRDMLNCIRICVLENRSEDIAEHVNQMGPKLHWLPLISLFFPHMIFFLLFV